MNLSTYINTIKENNYLVLIIILIILTSINAALMVNNSSHIVTKQNRSDSNAIRVNEQKDIAALQDTFSKLVLRLEAIEKQHHELIANTHRLQLNQQHNQSIQSAHSEVDADDVSNDWQENSEIKPDSVESYDQAMLQEAADDNWRMQLNVDINTMLSELDNPDTAINSIECRESTCRVEFIHTDSVAESAWLESIASSELFSGEMYAESSVNESGEEISLVYLSKP